MTYPQVATAPAEAPTHLHGCPHCGSTWSCLCMFCQTTRSRCCWPCKTAGLDDPPQPKGDQR
jgi:hypothetical protein